jgi:uncharacterized protein
MQGETNLDKLLKTMKPELNEGDFVFCVVQDLSQVSIGKILFFFKEAEGYTIVLRKEFADNLALEYSFVAAWITLTVHSALDAVGLTAAFSKALTENNISCNVVAGYYHDHIFVAKKDAEKAMNVLNVLAGYL